MPGYAVSNPPYARKIKIVIAGGFATGKTTLVNTVSEVAPILTEELMTRAGERVDTLEGVQGKATTTVAMDIGRVTLPREHGPEIVVMLIGVPGQFRFKGLWNDLSRGATGAVVLTDTRRLPDAFDAVAYFERRQMPFSIAVNLFDGAPRYLLDEVRDALDLGAKVPVMACDARDRESVRDVLIELVQHARDRKTTAPVHAPLGARR
ncbi:ATP-binding protein (plasmid) [Streptomyces alboflavus]|uniref:ATP-binding protein n=1 Tax=Streptomyces alboflavus TaxID=67267 RepID=A0A291W405_9ACTN|nr:ATP/GTP-binding protein [Streptomyces alboflavus]ATM24633.1 ATP-binding protein [Streptomyces alboflavus]